MGNEGDADPVIDQAAWNANRLPVLPGMKLFDVLITPVQLRNDRSAAVGGETVDVKKISIAEVIVHPLFRQTDIVVKGVNSYLA